MRARFRRLLLPGVFAVLLAVPAPAADILLNSDFRDGKTHWQGGGKEPTNMGGKLLVPLDPKKWTVIYQHFATRAFVLRLTMVYSLSPDCTLVNRVDGQTFLFTSDDLNDACGLHDDFDNIQVTAPALGLAFTVCSGGIMAMDHIYPPSISMTDSYSPTHHSRQVYDETLKRSGEISTTASSASPSRPAKERSR